MRGAQCEGSNSHVWRRKITARARLIGDPAPTKSGPAASEPQRRSCCAQNHNPTFCCWRIWIAIPELRVGICNLSCPEKRIVARENDSTPVPDLCFANMDLDATVCPQSFIQETMDCNSAVWMGHSIDIVEESEETFIRMELRLHFAEGGVLAQSVQHGHGAVTLFSAFVLMYLVGDPPRRHPTDKWMGCRACCPPKVSTNNVAVNEAAEEITFRSVKGGVHRAACCLGYRSEVVPKNVNATVVTIKTKRINRPWISSLG